jgi:hypothetical protein
MNFSGHANATALGLRMVPLECQEYQFFCRALNQERDYSPNFLTNIDASKVGSISAALVITNWLRRKHLFGDPNILAMQVLGIDFEVEYEWTQLAPGGQKFHFMKAYPEQSDRQAYENACAHIYKNLNLWISNVQRVNVEVLQKIRSYQQLTKKYNNDLKFWNGPRMYDPNHRQEVNNRMSSELRNGWRAKDDMRIELNNEFKKIQETQVNLALALHCLQDSFCPAHTLRSDRKEDISFLNNDEPLPRHYHVGSVQRPAPIRKLFSYAKQKQGKVFSVHAETDSHSGSEDHAMLPIAANATAALISMGVSAILKNQGLVEWTSFKEKWLRYEPYQLGSSSSLKLRER